ncbi:hypothetical protein Tco_0024372 [Tanacetum coccineum]
MEVLKLLEEWRGGVNVMENKLESMKILENKLESLMLQENQPVDRLCDKFSQMLNQYESTPEFGSGSGGCGDDEMADDEDGRPEMRRRGG